MKRPAAPLGGPRTPRRAGGNNRSAARVRFSLRRPRALGRDVVPLWRFLQGYSFSVRWRDPCAYTAELHGAVTTRFDESSPLRRYRRELTWAAQRANVFVSAPRSAADLERTRRAVADGIERNPTSTFVVVAMRWYDDPHALSAFRSDVQKLGAVVLLKPVARRPTRGAGGRA